MVEEKKLKGKGRKDNQRMKAYLVYEYLMQNIDANHVATGKEIAEYLQECGISAERRSITRTLMK